MMYIITGQTATGKTSYALKLAKELDGELMNADSRQLYKNLDIITGKDLDITDGPFVSHKKLHSYDVGYYPLKMGSKLWLYDILSPVQSFSAFEYVQLATLVIEDIEKRGKTPIIVGGTFFYIHQLIYGTSEFQIKPDQKLRTDLGEKSVQELQEILKSTNHDLFYSLNNSEKHNPQRLIRRIEIETHATDTNELPKSQPWHENDFSLVGLAYANKDDLRIRITSRVEERLSQGAVDEVKNLLDKGLRHDDPGMRTIGYAQIIDYLSEKISYESMKKAWITNEVQYAKRQLTLMKKNQHIRWVLV